MITEANAIASSACSLNARRRVSKDSEMTFWEATPGTGCKPVDVSLPIGEDLSPDCAMLNVFKRYDLLDLLFARFDGTL